MKALVLTGPASFSYRETPTPVPAPDEVLIRVRACSICGSDVHGCLGTNGRRIPPVIMGHEASGVIEQLGTDVQNWNVGDRVTFDSTQYCGNCSNCRKGMTNLCLNRRIVGVACSDYKMNGAMAEYIAVKAHTLYPIPDMVSFEEACLIEPLSVGLHAVALSELKADASVVIIGDGTIGLMTLEAVLAAGAAHVNIVGHHPERFRHYARHRQVVPVRAIPEADFYHADFVFDTVGNGETLTDAFSYVRTGGTIVCIGNYAVTADFPLQECIVRQIRVFGSYSSAGEYPLGLRLIQDKKVDLSPFLEHILPLSDGEMAFQELLDRKKRILKTILLP